MPDIVNRIPPLEIINRDTVYVWMKDMLAADLLYYFRTKPSEVIDLVTKLPMFNEAEARTLDDIAPRIYDVLGDDMFEIGVEVLDAEAQAKVGHRSPLVPA